VVDGWKVLLEARKVKTFDSSGSLVRKYKSQFWTRNDPLYLNLNSYHEVTKDTMRA